MAPLVTAGVSDDVDQELLVPIGHLVLKQRGEALRKWKGEEDQTTTSANET